MLGEEVLRREPFAPRAYLFTTADGGQFSEGGAIREPDALKALEFPTLENWSQIKAEVLPNQSLETWVAVTIDGLYAWIDSRDPLPQITLDLKPWKDYNRSQHGYQAIQIVYNSLPPCQQADIDDFLKRLKAAPPGQEVLYNLYTPCMFPDPWRPDQNQDYLRERDQIIAMAPDRFFLTQELSRVEKQSGVGAEGLKQQVRLIRLAANLSITVPILFLILLVVLALRSQMDLARWLGLPILVGGLLSLLPTLVYQPIVNALLTLGPMSEVPGEVRTEFARVRRPAGGDLPSDALRIGGDSARRLGDCDRRNRAQAEG